MKSQFDLFKGHLVVGIDLGTTNSGVSVRKTEWEKARMLPDKDKKELTPSQVGWDRDKKKWLVGRQARELSEIEPAAVAYSIKRYIGRRFSDVVAMGLHTKVVYKLEPGGDREQLRDVVVNFGLDREGNKIKLDAAEISAEILRKLRADATRELHLPEDQEIDYAVVTVPAYFNVLQRKATILAAGLAGFENVAIINEPTAAALAYRDEILVEGQERKILVYDLGGGTFDISLLEVTSDEDGYEFFTVVVDGDTSLGGDDIDREIVAWLIGELKRKYGHQVLPDDAVTLTRLRHKAEQAKIALSEKESVTIVLPYLALGSQTPFPAEIEMDRAQLRICAAKVIDKTQRIMDRAVREAARFEWADIDDVILVGGQTLMPAIQASVQEVTSLPPKVIDRPQEAVALGAGEYAHILSLGEEKFEENALSHAIALPLGIHIPRDEQTFRPLIEANKRVPTHNKPPWPITTVADGQKSIDVEILQGKRRDVTSAEDCVLLGVLTVDGLAEQPAGTHRFEVTFNVAQDGTFFVTVADALSDRPPEVKDITETRVTLVRAKEETEGEEDDE